MNLWQINQNLADAMAKMMDHANENGGEITPEMEFEIELIEFSKAEKIDNYARLILANKSDVETIDAEVERLAKHKRTLIKTNEWLMRNLEQSIDESGFKTPLFAFKWSKSEAVEIQNLDTIPMEYLRTKTSIEPDKVEIKKALKSGIEIKGASIDVRRKLNLK